MPTTVNCSVCGYSLGKPKDLERQVKKAGYETPSDWNLDPNDVTWLCGDHKADIGNPNWPDDVPYWHG